MDNKFSEAIQKYKYLETLNGLLDSSRVDLYINLANAYLGLKSGVISEHEIRSSINDYIQKGLNLDNLTPRPEIQSLVCKATIRSARWES